MNIFRILTVIGVAAVTSAASVASATERHFTYTYESGVLNPGAAELEPWVTHRYGRSDYYSRFDQQLEFELGITAGLQTALYWNMEASAQDAVDDSGATVRSSEYGFKSIASEWKYKFTDPLADAVGSAMYIEGALGPIEAEVEAKIILDKQVERWVFATNLSFEHEWEFQNPGEREKKISVDGTLGVAFMLLPSLSLGVEGRLANGLDDGAVDSSVLYAGPAFSYSTQRWWAALSVMPQLLSLAEASGGSRLDLKTQERLQTRIILGFHL